MQIVINGTKYNVPISISDITLMDRVNFDLEHGKKLNEKLKKVFEVKDKNLQELDYAEYTMELACRSVSFFCKIPLHIVQNTDLDQVFAVYTTFLKLISEETNFSNPETEIQHEFEWKGEMWCIHPVDLKLGSKMVFGEFVDAKQIVHDMYELGEEKWLALVNLCCIYLRKKDEKYDKSFPDVDGPRYQLMKTLPLDKALNVGFFLIGIINSFRNSSHFSSQPTPNQVANQ